MRRERGIPTIGLVACVSVCVTACMAACNGGSRTSARDASLLPPSERAGGGRPADGVSTRIVTPSLDFSLAYPKRTLEQRMAFLAAIDTSRRSTDRGVVADVTALEELYGEATDDRSFIEGLLERFELVAVTDARGRSSLDGLATGYATPIAIVREKEDARFRFPILGDVRRAAPQVADGSRAEILGSDAARATAIAWIDDPLSWALIETNGSARLLIDGTSGKRDLLVSRIGTNGRAWKGLGRAFAEKGLIDGASSTLDDVFRVARERPEIAEESALANDRVVYFARVAAEQFVPAFGIDGGRLVGGYSCAADQTIHPPGTILVVVPRDASGPDAAAAPRPARILFVHDVGGAIEGPGRIDAYFGIGTEALLRAGETRAASDVYVLRRRGRAG